MVPVIKLSFRAPSPTAGHSKTLDHIDYIVRRRAAILDPRERVAGSTNETYIKYMAGHDPVVGEDEEHAPLFGADGQRPPDVGEVKRAIADHPGVVYRAILSLRGDDADRAGYHTRADWEALARRSMPEIIAQMGRDPATTRWVAAMHNPEAVITHPHMHVVIWDESARDAERGKLPPSKLQAARRAWAQEATRPLRLTYQGEKEQLREAIREAGGTTMRDALGTARWMRWGDPPGNETMQQELARRITTLADHMPGHGRANLGFMPEAVRAEALGIADWVLSQPEFAAQAVAYQDRARDIAAVYSAVPHWVPERVEAIEYEYHHVFRSLTTMDPSGLATDAQRALYAQAVQNLREAISQEDFWAGRMPRSWQADEKFSSHMASEFRPLVERLATITGTQEFREGRLSGPQQAEFEGLATRLRTVLTEEQRLAPLPAARISEMRTDYQARVAANEAAKTHAGERAYDDLRRRIGNQVVRAAAQVNRQQTQTAFQVRVAAAGAAQGALRVAARVLRSASRHEQNRQYHELSETQKRRRAEGRGRDF